MIEMGKQRPSFVGREMYFKLDCHVRRSCTSLARVHVAVRICDSRTMDRGRNVASPPIRGYRNDVDMRMDGAVRTSHC